MKITSKTGLLIALLFLMGCASTRTVIIQVNNEADKPIEGVRIYTDIQKKFGFIYSRKLIHTETVTKDNGQAELVVPKGRFKGYLVCAYPRYKIACEPISNNEFINNIKTKTIFRDFEE